MALVQYKERKLRKKKEKVTTWNSRHSGHYMPARATWRIDIINCIGEGKTWRHRLGYFLYYENEREGERERERDRKKEEKERDLLIRSLKGNFSESIDQPPPPPANMYRVLFLIQSETTFLYLSCSRNTTWYLEPFMT